MCIAVVSNCTGAAVWSPPVYELDELFDLLAATPHPNHTSGDTLIHGWSVIKLQLATPSHAELRERFAELAPHERQCGLDDDLRGWFADERQHIGQRALASRSVPVVLQLAKTGIPLGIRGQAWLAALQLAPSEREYMHLATDGSLSSSSMSFVTRPWRKLYLSTPVRSRTLLRCDRLSTTALEPEYRRSWRSTNPYPWAMRPSCHRIPSLRLS